MTSNSVSDTSSLKLIPTPQNAQFVDGNHKTYSRDKVYTISVMEQETAKLRFAARYLKEQLEEQFGLHFNVQWRQLPNQEEDIVVYSNPTLQDTHLPLDLGVFDQENAAEQGSPLSLSCCQQRADTPCCRMSSSRISPSTDTGGIVG